MVVMAAVQPAIDQIIGMFAMRHGLVTAVGTMDMIGAVSIRPDTAVALIRIASAHLDHMLVDMVAMGMMKMPAVEIIDMAVMPDGRVAAVCAVLMRMTGMGLVLVHDASPCRGNIAEMERPGQTGRRR
jgi:hypothetical protein